MLNENGQLNTIIEIKKLVKRKEWRNIMGRKLTTEKFIAKAKSIHGDKYNYSTSIYLNNHTKISIKCPTHGIFLQKPNDHFRNHGCPRCTNRLPLSKKHFIDRSTKIHGNIYDYSNVIYINNYIPVRIRCNIHGEFLQPPKKHLLGQGCQKCGYQKLSSNSTNNTAYFITISSKKHNNKYDYSKSIYTMSRNKLIIICPYHGEFLQNANHHMQGRGCPTCYHFISGPETEFLDFLKIYSRQKYVSNYRVDGIKNNKIFEFLGDYWHGNPHKFNPDHIHPIKNVTYRKLFENTFNKFNILKNNNYRVYYIWELDWNLWKRKKLKTFPIKKY